MRGEGHLLSQLSKQPLAFGLGTIGICAVAIISTLFAADWLGAELTEPQGRFWDILLKAIGGIVAIVGAFVALSKFLDERRETNRAALLEAEKPFFAKRQEVYYDLVSCTAAISTRGEKEPERIAAEDKFWELFWGAVPMVADPAVGSAVDDFHVILGDRRGDEIALRNASMALARACRSSLRFDERHN